MFLPRALATLLLFAVAGSSLAEDWSEWRGPSRNGVLKASPALLDSLEGGTLKLEWEVELPAGSYRRPYYASPVASGGKAYLHISPGVPIRQPPPPPPKPKTPPKKPDELEGVLNKDSKSDDTTADITPSLAEMEKAAQAARAKEDQAPRSNDADDVLLCVDIATGKEAWRFEQPGGTSSMGAPNTPCVRDGRVYFVGTTGMLYCVDAASGKEVWRADASGGKKSGNFVASVIVLDGKAIVADSRMTAIAAATGARVWETAVDTGCGSPAPWQKDGRAFVITIGKEIACVAVADGKVLWRTGGVAMAASPVVVDDTLVAMRSDGNPFIYRLSLETAEKIGEFPIKPAGMGHQACTPCIDGKRLYAWDARRTFCYDLEKQAIAWEGEGPGDGKPSPILADGKLICNNGGKILVLNAADGKTLFSATVGVASCTSTAIAGGKLLVNAGTHLRCYSLGKSK